MVDMGNPKGYKKRAMKNLMERETDKILLNNVKLFVDEYYNRGFSRQRLADEYGRVIKKSIDPSYISQLANGHASIGKDVVEVLSKVFGKNIWEFYTPKEVAHATRPLRGHYVSVWSSNNVPKGFSEGGLPMGVSQEQYLTESSDPFAFLVRIVRDEDEDMMSIRKGDMLEVEPGRKANRGDIVWAHCMGMTSCKLSKDVLPDKCCGCLYYYFPNNDYIELRPINPKSQSIFVKDTEKYVFYPVTKLRRELR